MRSGFVPRSLCTVSVADIGPVRFAGAAVIVTTSASPFACSWNGWNGCASGTPSWVTCAIVSSPVCVPASGVICSVSIVIFGSSVCWIVTCSCALPFHRMSPNGSDAWSTS